MKYITTKIALVIGLFFSVIACTSTTVTRHTGNMFTVVATAESEKESGRLVSDRAKGVCAQQNIDSGVNVIDTEVVYQGIDKNQQKLVKIARDILPDNKTKGPYTPPDHEYKTTLTFKCK